MTREPIPGTVRDLRTGEPLRHDPDIEAVFLDQVERVHAGGDCYVIVGSGSPDGFVERIRTLGVPVVRDDSFGEAAVIVEGTPDESEDVIE